MADGRPFAGRNLLVFTAVVVILVTLVVQGTTMPAVVRWAGLRRDAAETTEERRARRQMVTAALEAPPDCARRLNTPRETVDVILDEPHQYAAQAEDTPEPTGSGMRAGLELRRALIAVERDALIRLRDQSNIDDIVLRRLQSLPDSEELRIELGLRAFPDQPPPPTTGQHRQPGRASTRRVTDHVRDGLRHSPGVRQAGETNERIPASRTALKN
ncbi:hypothetical protein [Streptomyces silvisoli]|uniref:Uncharacterized protein n=1 Tax=Streptomyces silvisoli TaxID=3034235 RepID=A0ABT5ZD51_9ACTN|nr:hypothetical protein [Streptomyces silvisoli]MDF3287759.1 hypothetical protein [Streptomyces silvisoli]